MAREWEGVLRQMLEQGYTGTQTDLCEALAENGFQVDQSTVSRALRSLGAVKQSLNGQKHYTLPNPRKQKQSGTNPLSEIIISISGNESLAVVKTVPGAAQFVAALIEHKMRNQILGTVAGDDTLLVIPKSTSEIAFLIKALSEKLSHHIIGPTEKTPSPQ